MRHESIFRDEERIASINFTIMCVTRIKISCSVRAGNVRTNVVYCSRYAESREDICWTRLQNSRDHRIRFMAVGYRNHFGNFLLLFH